jgi:hypothetical protein
VETEFLMDHRKRRHKKLIAEEATWRCYRPTK